MNAKKQSDRQLPDGYTVSGVVALSGGPALVGAECGVSMQAVSQWKKVPDRHIRTVARMSGLAPGVIRPDILAPQRATKKKK